MLFLATSAPAWSHANSLTSDTELSREGYFVLSWELTDTGNDFRLQQSTAVNFNEFSSRAIGSSGSLTITGLTDGDYHFRIADNESAVTDVLTVTVEHHELARAFLFFGVGIILFITLVLAIIHGNRRIGVANHE